MLSKPQGKVVLNVRMYSALERLDEVVVTQQRRQTTSLQTIKANEIKFVPSASGGGVESLLSTMAGVNSSNELSSQYSVRGGNFDENIVYVNGVEVYRPLLIRSGEQEGLSFINSDMVGNISFSSGGYSAKYGDKMSSVLDITYKEPESFEGSVSASLLGASASVGQRTGRFTQLHGIRYKTNSTLLSSLDTDAEYNPAFFDYQTYLTYQFSESWKASFLGNIASNTYNFIPHTRNTTFGTMETTREFCVYFDGQERDQFLSYFGSANLTHNLSKTSQIALIASAYLSAESVNYDIRGEYWLDELDGTDSDEAGGSTPQGTQGVGTYQEHARNALNTSVYSLALNGSSLLSQHQIEWGASVQREVIKDRVNEWELRDSAGYSLPYYDDKIELAYNLYSNQDIESTRLSAFGMDTYRLQTDGALLTLSAGVRASYWSFNKEFIVSPRLSLGYIPLANDRLTFRLAGGVYYQSPFYKEFRDTVRDDSNNLVVQLNRDIESQRSIHVVLGGDYSFKAVGRPFKITTELYYKHLSNLIPYEVDNVRIWYAGENTAKGYTAGVDVKLFGEFVPGTDSWLSFSLMSNKETIGGITVPRPTEQRYSVALFFQDFVPRFPKYKFHLRGVLSDGLPVGAPHTGRTEGYFRTPPYRRVDIGASRLLVSGEDRFMQRSCFKYLKSIWLGVDVFNLLDISNVNSYYWVTDVYNNQFAVPNYLTTRQINVRLSAEF